MAATASESVLDPVLDQLGALESIMSARCDAERLRAVDDRDLVQLAEVVASQERLVRAQAALIAGEVARRSRPEMGFAGLAQSLGHRTPAELMRVTTGSSLSEAKRSVAVGTMLVEAAESESAVPALDPATGELLDGVGIAAPAHPWMAPVLRGVSAGGVSVEQADAIRRGLGDPDPISGDAERDAGRVTTELLTGAAETLAREATVLDVDRLHVRARELRDELDVAGVALRERRRHEARSLRVYRQADGMSRLVWLMDPETAAVVGEVYDRVTSPKLGGPRFVDREQLARAESVERDPRTAEQYASDAFVELLRAGHAADPELLLGEGAPAVRVLVTAAELASGSGVAFLDGQSAPVSLATAERHICVVGAQRLIFDAEKRPLDLGRTSRLFTRKQRIALHARDGGCMFPGCERPPSWTEAHHIRHYVRDRGGTDIDDGISLCRHHHRLVHEQGWEFRHGLRDGAIRYELIPPPSTDPVQAAIPLPSKSRAYRRLAASAETADPVGDAPTRRA
ncbi:MAG: DUF222 domain-containing protein [Protaetiibacter sp.]